MTESEYLEIAKKISDYGYACHEGFISKNGTIADKLYSEICDELVKLIKFN